jgi:hypothetical protein
MSLFCVAFSNQFVDVDEAARRDIAPTPLGKSLSDRIIC